MPFEAHTNTRLIGVLACVLLLAGAMPSIACGASPSKVVLFTVSVKDFGAVGDGRHDDTRAFRKALQVAAQRSGGTVRVPAGEYRLSSLAIPDGVRVIGSGMERSWLHGAVKAGSHVTLLDLKIGTEGKSFRLSPGAHDSTFARCRFRGGGGESADCAVIMLGYGMGNDCARITFSDCKVECNLGVEDAQHSRDFNNISVFEVGAAGGSHVTDVTFKGCHIGVSNGVRSGSPRAGLEAFTDSSRGPVVHGWSNLRIVDCVFEATDEFCVDLADMPISGTQVRASGPALIRDSVLKGGGLAEDSRWGYTICVESPRDVVIEGNTVYRASNNTFKMGHGDMSFVAPKTIIRDNLFDLTRDTGAIQYPEVAYFNRQEAGNKFTGNNVVADVGRTIFELEQARDNTIVDNTLRVPRAATLFAIGGGSSGNVTAPNSIE